MKTNISVPCDNVNEVNAAFIKCKSLIYWHEKSVTR
jgi:hypothetical protein